MLVDNSISRDVVTTERVRKFSQRARAYACAYYSMHLQEKERRQGAAVGAGMVQQNPNTLMGGGITFAKIENLVKKFKTHRCALDFDQGFVSAVIREQAGGQQ